VLELAAFVLNYEVGPALFRSSPALANAFGLAALLVPLGLGLVGLLSAFLAYRLAPSVRPMAGGVASGLLVLVNVVILGLAALAVR
jgi:hypothetical protein